MSSSRASRWPIRSSRRPGQATTISAPGAQAFDLRERADAAVDGQAAQPGLAAQVGDGDVGLFGQLAGGREDQRAQFAARAFHQALQDGQNKGGGLAGAGLGQAQHVAPFQDGGDGLVLDGGGGGITRGGNTRVNLRVKCKKYRNSR